MEPKVRYRCICGETEPMFPDRGPLSPDNYWCAKEGHRCPAHTLGPERCLVPIEENGAPDSKGTNPKDAVGSGKVPLELFPDTAVVAGAMSFLEGAVKYGRYNWRVAGVRASIYVAAARRHLSRWWNGEDIDPDSGLPHLWKALACLAILIDAGEAGKLNDDRPPRVDLADMIDRMTPMVAEIRDRYADRNPHQYTIADSEGGS